MSAPLSLRDRQFAYLVSQYGPGLSYADMLQRYLGNGNKSISDLMDTSYPGPGSISDDYYAFLGGSGSLSDKQNADVTGGVSTTVVNLAINPRPASTNNWPSNNVAGWTPSYASNEISVNRLAPADVNIASSLAGVGILVLNPVLKAGVNYQRSVEVWVDQAGIVVNRFGYGFNNGTSLMANTWTKVVNQFTGTGVAAYVSTLEVQIIGVTTGVHVKLRRSFLAENPSGRELAYADGNSPGWVWDGAANASTSHGPAIYESITNPALSRWRTAIADRSTAPAKMLVIGDSISEGQGASTRANRWLSKSHDSIRAKYPTTGVAVGGENYVPSLYIVGAPDSPWQSFSGNQGSPTPSNVNGSLGYRTVFLDGTDGLFYNVTGTDVDIWWCGGGGTFAYQIDGGSVVNINTTGAYHTDYRTSVSLGASGPHTIGIAAVSGTCGFNGFTVYDGDKTKGIQYYDSCRSGAKSGDFLIEGGELVKAIQTVAPQLVIVELGGNDALQSIPVATFQSNLNSIVGGILGSVSPVPSVLLVGLYNVNQALLPGGIVWADYKAAIAAIAASDPTRIAYLDLTTGGMPTTDTSGAGYYRADGLHPNNSGHIKIAELVNGMIS